MESRCKGLKRELMESRYGDDPHFRRAQASLDRLAEDIEGELRSEKKFTDCYGEHLDSLNAFLRTHTSDQINERYSDLKSDLFGTSMAFFSSISDRLTRYLTRVKMRLKGLSADMKASLLGYMRDLWIEKIHPILQSFIDKMDKVAKSLKVDTYSVSLEFAFISVSFTFKPIFEK